MALKSSLRGTRSCTVEGELGVAGFLVYFFKDRGGRPMAGWLAGYTCSGEVLYTQKKN